MFHLKSYDLGRHGMLNLQCPLFNDKKVFDLEEWPWSCPCVLILDPDRILGFAPVIDEFRF